MCDRCDSAFGLRDVREPRGMRHQPGMEAQGLKTRYGERFVFWGGGVDTQQTLPFGTPDQVRKEVRERVAIFNPGGGFVFNTIHNIQAATPVENLLALFEAATGRSLKP